MVSWWILPNTKELSMPILLKQVQSIEEEGTLSNSLFKSSITLIQKPGKATTGKENYQLLPLMNINANILNILLQNWIQQLKWSVTYHIQIGFIPGVHTNLKKSDARH